MTIALKSVTSCVSNDDVNRALRFENKLLNGGCYGDGVETVCGVGSEDALVSRCQRIQADYVFEFLGFIFGLAVIALGWMLHKRGGRGSSAAYV